MFKEDINILPECQKRYVQEKLRDIGKHNFKLPKILVIFYNILNSRNPHCVAKTNIAIAKANIFPIAATNYAIAATNISTIATTNYAIATFYIFAIATFYIFAIAATNIFAIAATRIESKPIIVRLI